MLRSAPILKRFRKNTPEIDQMVVEHSMFLHQMDIYSVHRNLKLNLQATHSKLLDRGEVNEGGELTTKGKVIQLWNRYKRVTAIAASVGGAIALVISGLMVYFAPVTNSQLQQLSSDMSVVKGTLGLSQRCKDLLAMPLLLTSDSSAAVQGS
jgi:serine protease Do